MTEPGRRPSRGSDHVQVLTVTQGDGALYRRCESLEYQVFVESGYVEQRADGRIDALDRYTHHAFLAALTGDRPLSQGERILSGVMRIIYAPHARKMGPGLFPTLDHGSELRIDPEKLARIMAMDPRRFIDISTMAIPNEKRDARVSRALITGIMKHVWGKAPLRYALAAIDTIFYGPLNFMETAVALGSQRLFPSRRGRTFPGGRRVQDGTPEHLPAVRKLLDAADRALPIRRVYQDEELARMIVFRKNAFHALSYVLMDGEGRADGFLFGYKLPLGERNSAFFADGLVFRPGLPYRLKRSFLSECEGMLRDAEHCIGATLLSTASPENLLKYGYVPYNSQILGMDPYVETDLSPGKLRALRIELR